MQEENTMESVIIEEVSKSEDVELEYKGEVNEGFDKLVVKKSDFVTDDEKMVHHRKEVNQTPEEAEEEEVILTKLREVVRKSTHSDPMQRPTAEELLEILKR